MQNFFADMFEKIAEPRGMCMDGSNMYGCLGCDGDCLYNCSMECKDNCDTMDGGCTGCDALCGNNCSGSCGVGCTSLLFGK